MRVNLIGNTRKGTGVSQDMSILHGLISHVYGEDTQIRHIPHFYPQCPQAELNFFIEVVNPSLFAYAAKNIWIPNPEWTPRTWLPYAKSLDEIWVKTHEAEKLFWQEGIQAPKVRYVGWTSIDKVQPRLKNYHKAIVPVGKNIWRNPKPILQAYLKIQATIPSLYGSLPELHIVHQPEAVPLPPLPESLESKVKLHSGVMTESDYDELLHDCGLCICMSATEGFGHAVNEAMSAGCIPILSPIDAFRELTENALWVSNSKVTPHPTCLGNLEDIEVDSLVEALATYCAGRLQWRGSLSNLVRSEYEDRHAKFVARMMGILTEFKDTPEHSLEARLPKEEDLPKVSVITVTRDRRAFIPLAKYCFVGQSYPEDKLEWVIVDDGTDQIKDLVSDLPNVKYILCDEPMTIGAKRNLAVEKASHDILVMMDDDDVYPNNSILTRVAHMLAEPRKECLVSTTIPCYEIHETKSFMNVPPNALGLADRVSEATFCFTRAFWEARKFPDQQIAEGGAFLRSREEMCREMSPQDVIVSLCHKKTTSSRRPPKMEPNGSHYGFSTELFTLISEIAESL
jgi:glycosyltransferase involved in cell wall biosynthesis